MKIRENLFDLVGSFSFLYLVVSYMLAICQRPFAPLDGPFSAVFHFVHFLQFWIFCYRLRACMYVYRPSAPWCASLGGSDVDPVWLKKRITA